MIDIDDRSVICLILCQILFKEIFLKMESLQNTGSFKIRGMTNCFRVHEKEIRKNGAVTLSAGNAGRSFAFLCGRLNVTSTVCM